MMLRRPILKAAMILLAAAAIQFSPIAAHSSELDIFTIETSKFSKFQNAASTGGRSAAQYIDRLGKAVEGLARDNDTQRAAAAITTEVGVDLLLGLCQGGPVTCAVGTAGVGTALGVVLPIIFGSKDSNVTIFVANNSTTPLYLNEEHLPFGRMINWPARKAIPARTRDKVHVGIFVFEKKFGLFGTAGGIQLETTRNGRLKIGFGIPYRDIALIRNESRCAVSADRSSRESLRGFVDTLIERYSGSGSLTHTNSYPDGGRLYRASCGLTDKVAEFPSMLVIYDDVSASDAGAGNTNYDDIERARRQTPVSGGASIASRFERTPNAGIPGFNEETVDNVFAETCLEQCLGRSWCKSVDYQLNVDNIPFSFAMQAGRAWGRCFLQPVNKFEHSLKTDYPGNPYDHYHRIQ